MSSIALYPRLVPAYPQKGVHVLWGSGADPHGLSARLATILWAADISENGVWTRPQALDSADRFWWDDWTIGRPATDSRGRSVVAIPSLTRNGSRLTVVTYDAGWNVNQIPLRTFAAYAGSAVLDENAIAVAYYDATGTWLIRSSDWGKSWDEPKRVTPVGGDVTSLELVWHDRELHLFWGGGLPSGIRATAILHAVSSDRGTTWQTRDSLSLPTGFTRFRVATTACGIHLITDDFPQRGGLGTVLYARWSGKWSPVERLFPGVSHGPDIAVNERGQVLVSALVRADSPRGAEFIPMLTRLEPP